MGRAPKIYKKLNRPYLSDRELVYNYQNAKTVKQWKDAAYELWDKYVRVVSIGKRELAEVANRNGFDMSEILEDYSSLFWEKFLNQLYGIRLKDVSHLPNFSIYIRVMGYLRAMNRDQIRAYINHSINNQSIVEPWEEDDVGVSNIDKKESSTMDRIHQEYLTSVYKRIFHQAITEIRPLLSREQCAYLNLKIQKKFNYEILKSLNWTAEEAKYNQEIIKQKFDSLIKQISRRENISITYEELSNALQ